MSPHFILFSPTGYPSGLMHSLWIDQGAVTPLSYATKCVDEFGRPSDEFRKLFRSAFPAKDELPDVIATPEGKGTQRFLETFR